ncbi:2-hydroxyacid dehydrogenase [Gracilimonas sediminicola]|uniref:Glyoxylate/hydroxypyruvate reductase A n=1 Tax=Gracilimonas sediminicola TaxID=2952158 RepID=A0A9X2L1N1_9BACT|nr:glyoxylate/hydroxypyruvate reductase A [Gracilimonas sediminicola]MCP9290678.1 glyoxylate/hydroxypyruvate reductase A [Gracilimonas sediminicola]
MSLLLVAKNRDFTSLKKALLEKDPNVDVEIWPRVENKERVQFAVCWNHPKHVLDSYPNLRAVSSLGAGVNHLLNDEDLSADVNICRLITSSLKDQMAEYIMNAITNFRLHTITYADQRKIAKWEPQSSIPKKYAAIGIMGMGEMGSDVATLLLQQGYIVNSWSRSKKDLQGLQSFAGNEELDDFLGQTKILVNLLPLTDETEGILDLEVFKKLQKPGYLINVGRGSHLVEEDLIYALDTNHLEGACLDVFETEPLPENHPFWNRENIMITPHIAAITPAKEAAEVIIENYKRALSGMDLLYEVDRDKGY